MTTRPSNAVFAKAVRAAQRKIGFVVVSVYPWADPWIPGTIKNTLHHFPIRIRVIGRVTKREWAPFYKALNEALPEGNKTTEIWSERFRYYEVKPIWR